MGVQKIFSTHVPKQKVSASSAQTEEDAAAEEANRKARAALVSGGRGSTLLTKGSGGVGGVSTAAPSLLGG